MWLWNRHCFQEQRGRMYAHWHALCGRFAVLHCQIQTQKHASAKRPKVLTPLHSWTVWHSPDAKRPSKKIPATLPHTWDSSLHCMRINTHYCSCIYCCEIVLCIWMIILQYHIIESWNTDCWNSCEHCDCGMMTGIDYGQRNGGFNHYGLYTDSIGHPSPGTSCSKLMDAWKLNVERQKKSIHGLTKERPFLTVGISMMMYWLLHMFESNMTSVSWL